MFHEPVNNDGVQLLTRYCCQGDSMLYVAVFVNGFNIVSAYFQGRIACIDSLGAGMYFSLRRNNSELQHSLLVRFAGLKEPSRLSSFQWIAVKIGFGKRVVAQVKQFTVTNCVMIFNFLALAVSAYHAFNCPVAYIIRVGEHFDNGIDTLWVVSASRVACHLEPL